MNRSQEYPHVFAFLNKHHTGVLSTITSDSSPWGTAVYFVTDENFNTYFVTRVGTQKFRNIEANPKVALTVVDPTHQTTVQINGEVSKLPARDYKDVVFDKLAKLRPDHSANWAPPIEKVHQGDYVALKITPTKLQYADFSKAYTNYDQVFIEDIV